MNNYFDNNENNNNFNYDDIFDFSNDSNDSQENDKIIKNINEEYVTKVLLQKVNLKIAQFAWKIIQLVLKSLIYHVVIIFIQNA